MQNETKKELHTQMWKIENPKDFTPHDREVLEKAAAIIRAGGLVAFPTETVYGLGANALDEAAAKKIYAAKGRPSDNPLIAHVSCLEEIAPLVSNMPENGKKLAKAYWPGFKKDEIQMELNDGVLTISAAKGLDKDEEDKKGNYIRKERYAGSMSRSFYVGKHVTVEDVHPKYESGILSFSVPKAEAKPVEEKKHYISIEG